MLSFRKKMLVSDLILFLVFIGLLFPCVEQAVSNIVRKSLEARTNEWIAKVKQKTTIEEVVESLQVETAFLFLHVSLFDQTGRVLVDTPMSDLEEVHPEVFAALQYGRGTAERVSPLFRQRIAYCAFSFEMAGQEYVMRIGLPFSEIRTLTRNFEIGFAIFGAAMLFLYSIMTWAVMHRLSLPLQQLIQTITPYQEGREEFLPRIDIQREEFGQLARILNSLNARVQKQIAHLIQQKNETESILNSLEEGVMAVDVHSKVTFANRAACQMLNISHELILGQTMGALSSERRSLDQTCAALIQRVQEQSEQMEDSLTIDGTSKMHVRLIASPLAQQNRTLLILQDRTSDVRIVEMGKDFIANASHELRTPITIIRGFAETLHDLPKLSQKQMTEVTGKIVRTSVRLERLMKSLLDLADVEEKKKDRFRKIDPIAVCERASQLFLETNQNVQFTFHQNIKQGSLFADEDLLEMAITNLLQNACRYSPAPARIDLVIEHEQDQLRILVQDQGIGIPVQDLPHIFDRFYTVDKARSRKCGGTGLGLSIVKAIVQKHCGNVIVTSQLGKGSTFCISLPVDPVV